MVNDSSVTNEAQVAAIVLAAGASTRLGEPKQLLRFRGETLLARAVRVAREASLEPVVVVLGAFAERIGAEAELPPAIVVHNSGWPEGMASSIRAGVSALPAAANGVVLLVSDQPAVSAEHLGTLIADRSRRTASHYAERNGVPAFFPAADLPLLSALTGDAGARELLRGAHAIPLQHGELDLDTDDDVRRARLLLEG